MLEELVLIQSGRKPEVPHRLDVATLRRVMTDRNMILLSLMYFTQAYGFYFNITWLPTYLNEARRVFFDSPGRAGRLAADAQRGGRPCWRPEHRSGRPRLRAQGRPVRDRCSFRCWSRGRALIAGAAVPDPLLSALLIAVAGAADSFLLGAAWGTCLDIAGPHAGLVTGVMNTAGQLGAFLSPIVLAYLLKDQSRPEDWVLPLFIAGGLYLAGAVCWLIIDPAKPILAAASKPGSSLSDFELE